VGGSHCRLRFVVRGPAAMYMCVYTHMCVCVCV
jgi:hypothetical protein